MNELMDRLDQMDRPQCLCHIDANVDNFLMFEDGSAKLLDWEYAGMCDPIMDISMSAIYSYYDAVFANAALGGFLWCLWAVYKAALGEEFGEYTIIMYRYAKGYYKKLKAL